MINVDAEEGNPREDKTSVAESGGGSSNSGGTVKAKAKGKAKGKGKDKAKAKSVGREERAGDGKVPVMKSEMTMKCLLTASESIGRRETKKEGP